MGHVVRERWQQCYAGGRGFRQLGDVERALLAEHVPAPDCGGRALDVGCGTGELAAYLASLGYAVDACDFADSAIDRAQRERPGTADVRWLRLDIECDDPVELNGDGYDVITLRLMYPFLRDRSRVLHALGERLRPGGALVIITPTAEQTPERQRGIALDEDEIRLLTASWEQTERLDADGLAVLVLRGPCHADTTAVEKRRCAGPVFTPAAQALDAIWPGVVPGLAPIHAHPLAVEPPPVPGEPSEAVRFRRQMAEAVIGGGWAPSPPVRDALRTVPRHRYAPEKDLRTSYDADLAIVTRRDETGRATSSVSAAWLQADMLESLRLGPGAIVYEAGSGGYNAELIAHVVGPAGRVVTCDIDPYVVRRTRRLTAEAGSGRVLAFQGDAASGAPVQHVPRGGFDGSVITYNVWDIAPAWREQLTEGGRLVLPLEIGGYTRAVAFERRGDVLHARKFTHCGFVPAQGEHARTTPVVDLLGGELQVRFDDGDPGAVEGLEEALRGPRHEVATGVTMSGGFSFGSLQLYAATTLPGFCRLAAYVEKGTGATRIAKGSDAPAILGDGSLAHLVHVQTRNGDSPAEQEWEWRVDAFGDRGPRLAERLAATVRTWDRDVRGGAGPALSAHPAGTPDHRLPSGDVLDKAHCRLVLRWPGRDALLPAPGGRGGRRAP